MHGRCSVKLALCPLHLDREEVLQCKCQVCLDLILQAWISGRDSEGEVEALDRPKPPSGWPTENADLSIWIEAFRTL